MRSELEKIRIKDSIPIPDELKELKNLSLEEKEPTSSLGEITKIQDSFPNTYGKRIITCSKNKGISSGSLTVGVVFSGGQAPGGHNVIAALYDALHEINPKSKLIGFLNGPSGILEEKTTSLTKDKINNYRNIGGFDLIGSGRTKIETQEQFETCLHVVDKLSLDGLVIIGGDDSNTNAAFLAEYFAAHNNRTSVIGIPKTIDGDLKNEHVAISFGFDTACKTYAEMIGNIGKDALSAKKYYHFIRVMGRSASHIALECAHLTHPNLVLISEEIKQKKATLHQIVDQIADLVQKRVEKKKKYGLILIPEGIIEFIPECKQLIQSLNRVLSSSSDKLEKLPDEEKVEAVQEELHKEMKELFSSLPFFIQRQFLIDRDPHGNVQLSKIDTEKLLFAMVDEEMKKRSIPFQGITHFFGYEGRSALPTLFDANYCYALGRFASLLIKEKKSGYMASVSPLDKDPSKWKAKGVPLTSLLHIEERKGKEKIVIRKSLVNLDGKIFHDLARQRAKWEMDDEYLCPGPIQFFGKKAAKAPLTVTQSTE